MGTSSNLTARRPISNPSSWPRESACSIKSGSSATRGPGPSLDSESPSSFGLCEFQIFSILGSPDMGCPFPSLHHAHPDNKPLSRVSLRDFLFLAPTLLTRKMAQQRPAQRAPTTTPPDSLSTSPGSSPGEEKGP